MCRHVWLTGIAALLSGCAVGPDFHRPDAPTTDRYSAIPAQTTDAAPGHGGSAQSFAAGTALPGRWWELFRCDALNSLVDEALAHSPTVLEAQARLRQAQADLTAQSRGTLYPQLDGQLSAARQKFDPAAFGIPSIPAQPAFTLYNVQVNASYALDVFGGNRRLVEGARAQAEYQSYEAEAAELTLAANVVAAAIRQAALEDEINYSEEILTTQTRQLAISEERYRVGGVAQDELENERAQLEQTRALLPPLRSQREAVDHQLAVYTGKAPAEAALPRFRLEDLTLPGEVPLSLPSELVRRRPDIRAAEAQWHEAAANVGVATANMFPHLSISGYIGSERTQASQIADGTNVWSLGATLMQPIFHAGELRAKKRSAEEAYTVAAQKYEQTVLEALQQVADGLKALQADATTLQARSTAAQRLATRLTIAQRRYTDGGISEFSLLDVQRQQLQSALDRDQLEAQRYSDTVALLHALSGNP